MSTPENADTAAPQACSACRGTGSVLAKVGEELKSGPCPWCDGTGLVQPDHDAQARWRQSADA
jgi:DnaJ-class molecular chaperone